MQNKYPQNAYYDTISTRGGRGFVNNRPGLSLGRRKRPGT